MSTQSKTKILGTATAYGYAVKHGYTGTEEEFGEEQAKFAENAKKLRETKEEVVSMKESVEEVKTQVEQLASNAGQSATNAHDSETKAKDSETKAKDSETKAKESENKVKESETSVSENAKKAGVSESNAKQSEQNALQSANRAGTSETNARQSEENARQSALSAAQSAEEARNSNTTAYQYAEKAAGHETRAREIVEESNGTVEAAQEQANEARRQAELATQKAGELEGAVEAANTVKDGIVKVDEDPVPETRLHITTSEDEVEIPDMNDFNGLRQDLNELKSGVSDSIFVKLHVSLKSGFYISVSGDVLPVNNTYYSVSDPIDIGEYSTLQVTARANWGHMMFAFYDTDGIFISGEKSTNSESSTTIENKVVIRPSNAKYIRLSKASNVAPYTECSYKAYRIKSNDKLFGKKWCVMGDSFSYGGYSPMNMFEEGKYIGCRKVYPYYIGNRTHIDIVDFTLGGRTLAYPSDGSFSNSITNPNADCYYQKVPVDTDYLTIYLGINDSHHASGSSGTDGEDTTGVIPIGTIDDATTSTFGGAWNVVLSWLMENRPNTHIGIIVSNGVDNVDYRTLTIEVAKKYGIPYIDMNGDERTPAMVRSVNPDISSSVKEILKKKWSVNPDSNTHPNDKAHEYESWFIESFLRSL